MKRDKFSYLNNLDKDLKLKSRFIGPNQENFIIACRGHIDLYNAKELEISVIKSIKEIKPKNVILDLRSVNYIDPLGVNSIVKISLFIKKENIDFKIYDVNPKIKDILSMLGFSQFFVFIDDLIDYNKKLKIVFPLTIKCPYCAVSLKTIKSGKFKCSGCTNIIRVNDDGNIEGE